MFNLSRRCGLSTFFGKLYFLVQCFMIATELSSPLAVPIYKQQKIDLRETYPCPCCRGNLQQIVLTEALGCDRCQKIFALQRDGYIIEQTSSPYHNCWRWDGKRWKAKNPAPQSSWILFGGLVLTAAFAIGGLHLLSRSPEKTPIAPVVPKTIEKH
jgi:hypothetical protein